MARARTIKPSFFKNEELAELPMEARLLFIGLWTLADAEGKLEWRPKRIKAEIFPYDDIDCTGLVRCLHGAGFIQVYESDGLEFVYLPSFQKHQHTHVKEKPQGLPDFSIDKVVNWCKPGASPVQARCQFAPLPSTLNLNPSTVIPLPLPSTTDSGLGTGELQSENPTESAKAFEDIMAKYAILKEQAENEKKQKTDKRCEQVAQQINGALSEACKSRGNEEGRRYGLGKRGRVQ